MLRTYPVMAPLALPNPVEYDAPIALRRVLRRLEAARTPSPPASPAAFPHLHKSSEPRSDHCVIDVGLASHSRTAENMTLVAAATTATHSRSTLPKGDAAQRTEHGVGASILTGALALCAALEAWRRLAPFLAVA